MANTLKETLGVGGKAGDKVGNLVLDLLAVSSLALNHDNGLQTRPTLMMADVFKGQWVSNGPTAANFNPPTGFVGGLMKIVGHSVKMDLLGMNEPILKVLTQVGLIVFD